MSTEPIKRRRGPGRPWAKGQSGNPAGRPKSGLALAEYVRDQVEPSEMVERAIAIMRAADDTRALAALTWLRDSGFAKPATAIDVTARSGEPTSSYDHLSLDRRRELLAELRGHGLRLQEPQGTDDNPA